MNFVQFLDECPAEVSTILAIVKFVLNGICIAVPIILIVLIVIDLSKVVTAGNLDDKMKKEVTNKVVTRLIFAVLIFLVPTVVRLVFTLLPIPDSFEMPDGNNVEWTDCWDNATIAQ